MGIVFCGIAPHPPIVLPEVGGTEAEKVKRTREAMQEFCRQLKEKKPEAIVFITPHGVVFSDALGITTELLLEGDLSSFGVSQVKFRRENDSTMADLILGLSRKEGIPVVGLDERLAELYGVNISLDHGILVPLYFLDQAGINIPIVPVSIGMLPYEELYSFGAVLQTAAEKSGKNVAIIASGDLSHRLTRNAPAGYSPYGTVFDTKIQEAIKEKDIHKLIEMESEIVESSGECGLRPIIILLGTLDGWEYESSILSYEGPFGVGYMVATLLPIHKDESRTFKEALFAARNERIRKRREKESPYVALARNALETFVKEGKRISLPEKLPVEMQEKAGVFVSLKKHGQLRGCIGTFAPTTENIAHEIVQNAISAGTNDPRFPPVEEEELSELIYSVDILSPPEPVHSLNELDPKRYGIIVTKAHRSGLLLPNLEGVDTVEEQLRITKQKAGIPSHEQDVHIQRFEVKRYF